MPAIFRVRDAVRIGHRHRAYNGRVDAGGPHGVEVSLGIDRSEGKVAILRRCGLRTTHRTPRAEVPGEDPLGSLIRPLPAVLQSGWLSMCGNGRGRAVAAEFRRGYVAR